MYRRFKFLKKVKLLADRIFKAAEIAGVKVVLRVNFSKKSVKILSDSPEFADVVTGIFIHNKIKCIALE